MQSLYATNTDYTILKARTMSVHIAQPVSIGHRPVIVKRAGICSKGGWKLSTIFLSCKVLNDWSIIKLGKHNIFKL